MSAQQVASMWPTKTGDNSWASQKCPTLTLIIRTILNELNIMRQNSEIAKEIKILIYRKEAITAQIAVVTSTVSDADGAMLDINISTNNNRWWGAQGSILTYLMSQVNPDSFDYQSTTSQSRASMKVERACAPVVPTIKARSIRILLQLNAVNSCIPTLISPHLSRKCRKSARIYMKHPGL